MFKSDFAEGSIGCTENWEMKIVEASCSVLTWEGKLYLLNDFKLNNVVPQDYVEIAYYSHHS
jgi:hypothetical protein